MDGMARHVEESRGWIRTGVEAGLKDDIRDNYLTFSAYVGRRYSEVYQYTTQGRKER